jgi:hypothetical protein
MSSEQLAEAARLYDEKRYEDALAQYALLANKAMNSQSVGLAG